MRSNQCTARPGEVVSRFYQSILVVALGCGLLVPGPALAGQIFGQVLVNGADARGGVPISVNCGGQRGSGQTDGYGSYKVNVAGTGRCTLSITYDGSPLSLAVVSYKGPVRYILVITGSRGSYTMRRR
jgi:hypothetical protein